MKTSVYKSDFWKKIREQTKAHLGEDFWNEMNELFPNESPRVDLFEHRDIITVVIELPGLEQIEQIQVYIHDTTLHIKGSIPCPYPVKEEALILSERYFGYFHRKIELPAKVIAEPLRARYKRGLLVVTIRKKTIEHQEIPIPIETEEG